MNTVKTYNEFVNQSLFEKISQTDLECKDIKNQIWFEECRDNNKEYFNVFNKRLKQLHFFEVTDDELHEFIKKHVTPETVYIYHTLISPNIKYLYENYLNSYKKLMKILGNKKRKNGRTTFCTACDILMDIVWGIWLFKNLSPYLKEYGITITINDILKIYENSADLSSDYTIFYKDISFPIEMKNTSYKFGGINYDKFKHTLTLTNPAYDEQYKRYKKYYDTDDLNRLLYLRFFGTEQYTTIDVIPHNSFVDSGTSASCTCYPKSVKNKECLFKTLAYLINEQIKKYINDTSKDN